MSTSGTGLPAPGASAGAGGRTGSGLRAGSLRLGHLVFVGLAIFSLAPAIYFNMGLMESDANGPVMPLLFAVITVAILPTAVSYAVMNNRRPSAGATFTWWWELVTPSAGLWQGWMVVTAYFIVSALYPPLFGLFFNSFLSSLGVTANVATSLAGGILAVVIVALFTWQNIRLSVRSITVLMAFEAGFVAVLAFIIIVTQGVHGKLSIQPFNPAAAHAGISGLALGTIFAFLSIAAVDCLAPLAEEANTPRSLVPLATIVMTLAAGGYWVITSYGFAVSAPVSDVLRYVNSGQVTPVLPIAKQYIGAASILVPITGMTAALASFAGAVLVAGRLLHALGREKLAPAPFGRLSKAHQTPWNAELAVLAGALVGLLVITWWQGDVSAATAWIGESFVFFILIPYLSANVANILYHRRRPPGLKGFLLTRLLPALGIIIDGYILYKAFFATELGQPFRTGSSIVWFALAWSAIGVLWVWRQASKRRLREISLTTLQEDLA
jgi:amino acid transporter